MDAMYESLYRLAAESSIVPFEKWRRRVQVFIDSVSDKKDIASRLLFLVARKGSVDASLTLIEFGADVNYADDSGVLICETLLFPLSTSGVGLLPVLSTFIASGLNPNAKNGSGTPLLHVALSAGAIAHAVLLMTHGADPFFCDPDSHDTAFDVAERLHPVVVASQLRECAVCDPTEWKRIQNMCCSPVEKEKR